MTVAVHPAAAEEFVGKVDYYEAAGAGLGQRFRDAVRVGLDRIVAYPEIGTRRGMTRRLVVDGFPHETLTALPQCFSF